jgi:hypothetical protein
MEEIGVVNVDANGQFSMLSIYNCADKPDLYFWVEQFQEGTWQTIYKPSLGCNIYWNYNCGSEIVINVPNAIACDAPPYDVPIGVNLFVLPYAIGNTPIWGDTTTTAPLGWVRRDGYTDYDTSGLGVLNNAPFGGTLTFIHDDSYFIPLDAIKYYRYSYRRVGDVNWTPISTAISRGYRIERSSGLPHYSSYAVGPKSVGTESALFEFKPVTPPPQATDPANTVIREWSSGNLSEAAAIWDTVIAAPPISNTNVSDDSGDFEIKLEVFDKAGHKVFPSASTFDFLTLEASKTSTRKANAAEIVDGAYIIHVHIDNNYVQLDLPQPDIGGMSASNDCGFLLYTQDADNVRIRYLAAHPNNHAVFNFEMKRGANKLLQASTAATYVEVSALVAATSTTNYNKLAGYYQHAFNAVDLVGTCVNAAFASYLTVYGKATNGYHRLGIDAANFIAFALAKE